MFVSVMRKLRPVSVIKQLRGQSPDSKPSHLTPKSTPLTTILQESWPKHKQAELTYELLPPGDRIVWTSQSMAAEPSLTPAGYPASLLHIPCLPAVLPTPTRRAHCFSTPYLCSCFFSDRKALSHFCLLIFMYFLGLSSNTTPHCGASLIPGFHSPYRSV